MSLDFSLQKEMVVDVYSGNYTHNLTPMWKKAGVYDALYNSQGDSAGSLIPMLEKGYKDMQDNPNDYLQLNPENGWGDYYSGMGFLREILLACKQYADAEVRISK